MFEKEYGELKKELAELEQQFNNPGFTSEPDKMRDLGKRYGEVKELVTDMELLEKTRADIVENGNLSLTEEDPSLKEMLEEDSLKLNKTAKELEEKIKKALVPPDPNDSRNAILEIRAGAGGDEASLFAADLFRAYSLYGQNHDWKMEILNHHRSEVGGYKEIIAFVSGRDIYKALKNESGVHRVQRIPATEKSGRIHTSTITVAVMPEAETTEIEINPKDIRIDVFR